MRSLLSNVITQAAKDHPKVIVLSGDHGYALFDEIRTHCPRQFINVGVMEQAMVGIAAGLAKRGFRPIVYGLSAFVPIRVLEQIKLDICFQKLPVTFLGDGAGLVYSTLGASHQCAEDLACLRTLPGMQIFSPCDKEELRVCFGESMSYEGPSYIRIGKSDRPLLHLDRLSNTEAHRVLSTPEKSPARTALVSTGSMVAAVEPWAVKLGLPLISVPRIKPVSEALRSMLGQFSKLVVIEEHVQSGGLTSSILETQLDGHGPFPAIRTIALKEHFSQYCGSYQYALSEHQMSDVQLGDRLQSALQSLTIAKS